MGDLFNDKKFIFDIRRFARSHGICECLLDDFVQELFLLAIEKGFESDKELIMSWAIFLVKPKSSFCKKYRHEIQHQNFQTVEALYPSDRED